MKKLVCFLLFAFATVVFADKYDDWVNVDVKAIITKSERDAFKKLKTEADKEKFVQDFWAKRGPQYKEQYEANLADVNAKIQTKSHKGSETDIGMLVLLFGPPDDQKKEGAGGTSKKSGTSSGQPGEASGSRASGEMSNESDEEGGGGESARRPATQKMTFIYKHLPPEVASGEVDIVFNADPSSQEWKFADKKKTEALMDKGREFFASNPQKVQAGSAPAAAPQAAPAAAPPKAAVPVTTPELKAAMDAAATGTAPKDIPLTPLVDAFLDSKDTPFIATAASTTGDMASAKVGVRVLDGSGAVVKETEVPYANVGEGAGYFQTEVPVTAAGQYNVVVGLANGGKAGAVKETVKTPDTAVFSMSSIILADSFTQLTDAKPEGVAYTFGKIKVQPSIDHAFEKTAPNGLIIVYEAYNFQVDAATQKPNLEVVYEFQKGSDKPQKTPPAAPNGLVTGKKMTIPTSFPLTNFPNGSYKLTIQLTDKASGKTASSETSFSVK